MAYRVENPRSTIPSRGVKDCPQVEEEHSGYTATVHLLLLPGLGVCDFNICTYEPEAD